MIAKTLGELDLIEEWGSGYKRIKDACEKGGYPMPKWEEFGSALRVTFYPHPELEKTTIVGTKFKLDPKIVQLLAFCQEPKTITELMDYMGWKNRTKFRKKYINPLVNNGLLEMTIPEKPRSSKQKYRISRQILEMI